MFAVLPLPNLAGSVSPNRPPVYAAFLKRSRYAGPALRACLTVGALASAILPAARPAMAQGTIVLRAGTGANLNVQPGAKFSVPVALDMSGAAGANLASLTAVVTWSDARITLDSIRGAAFGTVTSSSFPGVALLSVFSATGATTSQPLADLFFTAASTAGGTQLFVGPGDAGNELGTSVITSMRTQGTDVCVAVQGKWGDATGDDAVNIIDAQQIARFTVALAVANSSALGALGDVNADNTVNIVDAQQVARFSVALAAAARLGTNGPFPPAVVSMAVTPVGPTVSIGQTGHFSATPMGAGSLPLHGCAPVAWSSSNPGVATVDAAGSVTAVALGTATITATARGQNGSTLVTTVQPVASFAMTPDTATIRVGSSLQLTATPRDAGGLPQAGRVVDYMSTDEGIAAVSSTGLVTTSSIGTVSIIATIDQFADTTTLQVSPLPANALAMGDRFACALTVKGEAYCWGSNSLGQLGDGSATSSSVPVRVAVTNGMTFTQISAAGSSACALATDDMVYCWGQIAGRAGSYTPVLLSSTLNAASVRVGAQYGCALDQFGFSHCWGRNTRGALGTGDTVSTVIPVPTSGFLQYQSLSSGLFHPCGLTTGGAAYCWGDNAVRTLGVAGTPAFVLTPTPVVGGLTFTSLVSGGVLTCGVETSGTAHCWGTSYFGAGGTGGTTAGVVQATPTAVQGGVVFAKVTPSAANSVFDGNCGLATDGTAYCWGANSKGQVGSTATLPATCTFQTQNFPCTGVPTAVTTTAKFSVLLPGLDQTCGITTTGVAMCWGWNNVGQLGDGTLVDKPTPVAVVGGLRLP